MFTINTYKNFHTKSKRNLIKLKEKMFNHDLMNDNKKNATGQA